MIEKIVKAINRSSYIVAKGVADELLGYPKSDDLKLKIRIEIKSIESYLLKNKSKISSEKLSKFKSKCNSLRNDTNYTKDIKKLESLLSKAKDFSKEVKK